MADAKIKVMLDSGAYSAWRQGWPIKMSDYARFCEKHQRYLYAYINMDQMPGEVGRHHSPGEVEEAAKTSHKNLMWLMKRGLEPLPVYHYGERRYWLERLVDFGHPYICLSFSGRTRNASATKRWLDGCFHYLTGGGGYPAMKVHGLGVTAIDVLFDYPWYSVDSTSWRMHGAYGAIIVPHLHPDSGRWDYTRAPKVLVVTDKGRKAPAKWRIHYDRLGPKFKDHLERFLEEEGFTLKQMADEDHSRGRICLRVMKRYSSAYIPKPFAPKSSGFFDDVGDVAKVDGGSEAVDPIKVFYVVSGLDNRWMVEQEQADHHLLSFARFYKNPVGVDMKKYVTTGRVPSRKRMSNVKKSKVAKG